MTEDEQKFATRYDFTDIEKRCITKWEEEQTYRFELTPQDTHDNIFSIDTPPDFTSGNLHMGHILNHSWIDFMARFRRFQGKKVYFPQGFDCHGLPTELKVQNLAGIRPSENRDLFLKTCHEYTERFIINMTKQFKSLGYSTDWNYTYKTMNEKYIKLVQQSLLTFYKQGLLYRGKHPVHWCPKCETSLAKQEVGYMDVQGKIFEINLPIHGKDGEFVTIATTRPEMMEACVAVFVHPEDERYKTLKDARIDIPIANRTVPLLMDMAVDKDFGTGAVYCCTFGDETDIMWQQKYHLPIYQVISYNGRMTDLSVFMGMTSKQAQKEAVKTLESKNLLVSEKRLPHRVIVHTERASCLSPIEYLPIPQWFIKVKDFTKQIKEDGLSLRWHPDLSRNLTDWCDSLTWDWVVSRQRVFGTPIPFWYCSNLDCDYVIPAKKEDLPLDPTNVAPPIGVCPKCGSKIIGEKDVCDCWVDSSITPLRISQWTLDDDFFNKVYPTTNRPQGYEIIRTWLFYTLFRSKMLSGKRPFEEIMLNGMVAGPDGRKMSKSFGNIVSPDEVFPAYGTDAVRLWAAMGPLGQDYQFKFEWVHRNNPKQKVGKKILQEKNKVKKGKMTQEEFDAKYIKEYPIIQANAKFMTKIWNAYRLIWLESTSLNIDSLDLTNVALTPIDHYVLQRLNEVKQSVFEKWDKYIWKEGTLILRGFFKDELCDAFLESIKYRFHSDDVGEKVDAVKITLRLFFEVLKMFSIIAPFITEELYQNIFKQYFDFESIHLALWPETIENINSQSAELGKLQLEAISKLRQAKSKAKMALNKEILKSQLFVPVDIVEVLKQDLEPILKTLKIKSLKILDLNNYSDTNLPETAVHIQDGLTKWISVILNE
ncbi:MAG: valine--tRNA ligase [Promethearchaeota archaeon]